METAKETFIFSIDLDTLMYTGIDGLNNYLDEQMEEAGITHIATDIAYRPVNVDLMGNILIEATYTPEFDEEEDSL